MNPYFFGLGGGHLPDDIAKIAVKHGAELVNYTEPNGKKRHWFQCQNMGEPFDSNKAKEILLAIEKYKENKK